MERVCAWRLTAEHKSSAKDQPNTFGKILTGNLPFSFVFGITADGPIIQRALGDVITQTGEIRVA
jgi:hypothetical protein